MAGPGALGIIAPHRSVLSKSRVGPVGVRGPEQVLLDRLRQGIPANGVGFASAQRAADVAGYLFYGRTNQHSIINDEAKFRLRIADVA